MKALVDCNNFFVSCERVFEPGLRDKPVAVLSSNDGCIVARSNEVKAMGIPMGAPAFKYDSVLKRHHVVLKSSNFPLYTDMSRRVMATLREYTSGVEIYSVDEAFIELDSGCGYEGWSATLRDKVSRDTGIPVSVGVAPTKTLAKAAATLAKRASGVMSFADMLPAEADTSLKGLPIEDVWGIGRKLSKQFRSLRIRDAYELKHIPSDLLGRFNISIRRMVLELNGTAAEGPARETGKSMISTRSFSTPVSSRQALGEALSMHAVGLAAKLRREGLTTQLVAAFISTGVKGRFFHARIGLDMATSDSRQLVRTVLNLLPQMYKPGLQYKKAGVMAYQLVPLHASQLTLGSDAQELAAAARVDATLDKVNHRWGPHALKLAAEGVEQAWQPKHAMRSPRYTTEWAELKVVG